MADDYTFEQWKEALNRYLIKIDSPIAITHLDNDVMRAAYMGNDTPQEFFTRINPAKPGPIAVGPSLSEPVSWSVIQPWLLLGLGILGGYQADNMDIVAPGTQIVNEDLLFQRLALQIGSEVLVLAAVVYFAANRIIRAVQKLEKA
jgi:hypothetical protein